MWYLICLIIGLLTGWLLTMLFLKPKHSGSLYVYDEDSKESPSLYLELEEPVESIRKSPYVTFKTVIKF